MANYAFLIGGDGSNKVFLPFGESILSTTATQDFGDDQPSN